MPSSQTMRNRTKRLYKKQGGKCYYCETPDMYLREDVSKQFFRKNRKLRATFDHVIPKSDGGKDSINNGVCACSYCNGKKGHISFYAFMAMYDAKKAREQHVVRIPALTKKQKQELTRKLKPKGPERNYRCNFIGPIMPKQIRIARRHYLSFIKNSYALAWFAAMTNRTVGQMFMEEIECV